MHGFTHTFLNTSSHGKLPVCQGRCSKVSLKKVKELEFYFSPDALHIFILHNSGIHSASRQPLSNGTNAREPQELRRDENHKRGRV